MIKLLYENKKGTVQDWVQLPTPEERREYERRNYDKRIQIRLENESRTYRLRGVLFVSPIQINRNSRYNTKIKDVLGSGSS